MIQHTCWKSILLILGLGGLLVSTINLPEGQASQRKSGIRLSKARSSASLVAAVNEFGFDLFHQLLQQNQQQNVFVSPVSIATALVMPYNGAAGETRQAMARTLKIQDIELQVVNEQTTNLLSTLKTADKDVQLSIANSLWSHQGMDFTPDFLARNRQYFSANIATLDFASPGAPAAINRWVDSTTQGKIKQIVERLDARDVLLLINALYFKGLWQDKFDKANTKDELFYLLDGNTKQVPMMSRSNRYAYLRGEHWQAVNVPYGNGSLGLYLFLPDHELRWSDFLKSMSYQNWEQWITQFRPTQGDIKLPRFKLEYDKELNDALKALGMDVAFTSGRADFTAMRVERDLFISQVKHKTFIEVSEEGTTAAAATSVMMSRTAATPAEKFTFVADHPFFAAISDTQTGAVLFIGVIAEPK